MATDYAIVESGGKQYRVEKGDSFLVDRIAEDEGAKVQLRAVMFRGEEKIVLEPSELEKVKVEAKVAAHERGEKIQVFKYKAKKGYRRRQGHRSELTRLEVMDVKLLSRRPAKKKAEVEDGAGERAAPEKAAASGEAETVKKAPAKSTKAAAKPKASDKGAAAAKPAGEKPKPKTSKPAAKPKASAKAKPDSKASGDKAAGKAKSGKASPAKAGGKSSGASKRKTSTPKKES